MTTALWAARDRLRDAARFSDRCHDHEASAHWHWQAHRAILDAENLIARAKADLRRDLKRLGVDPVTGQQVAA